MDMATDENGAMTTYLEPDERLLAMAEKIRYKETPQEDMCLYLLRPEGVKAGALPAVVYFTGGGWENGSPAGMIANAAWFRDHGVIGISADYRVKSRHGTTPIECIEDARSAIRYVRANAGALGVDPARIVACGGSAGGHIAAATVLDGHDDIGDDLAVSPRPAALLLHNPVLGAGFRMDFFNAHPECSPLNGVRKGWPPTIVSNGTEDNVTPYAVAERFVGAMKAVGNVCELITIPGAGHSCDWPVSNPHFLPTMTRMAEFLWEQGVVPGSNPSEK